MRRITHLLCAAGLAVAPSLATADTKPSGADRAPPTAAQPRVETFTWSTATSRGRLGVMVIGLTPELRAHFGAADDRGVLVGRIEPKSAAEAAGLEVGDVITEVRGTSIDSAGDVLSALSSVKQGESVSITVIRGGRPQTLQATLTSPPAPSFSPGASAMPRSLDDWLDDMRRRFHDPSAPWFDDFFRPWPEQRPAPNPGPSQGKGALKGSGHSTRT